MVVSRSPRVVTVGGGHGQAAVLAALRGLRCQVTAVVSVADDGGCSGRLTKQFGMPPPGDMRRCLTTLACDGALARRFEERAALEAGGALRCVGNLALLGAYVRLGSLQLAADWAARLLRCWGRVVPAAAAAGRLVVYDRGAGTLHGETTVAARGARVMAVAVHDIERSHALAHEAIAAADVLLLGPGSFVTSTLAAVTTGQIAQHIVTSRARKVLIHNLAPEPGQLTELEVQDYVRLLRDHLGIHHYNGAPDADNMPLTVLCHRDALAAETTLLRQPAPPHGTTMVYAPLALETARSRHHPQRLALALARLLSLDPCVQAPTRYPAGGGARGAAEPDDAAAAALRRADFERHLRCGEALVKGASTALAPRDAASPQAVPSKAASRRNTTR